MAALGVRATFGLAERSSPSAASADDTFRLADGFLVGVGVELSGVTPFTPSGARGRFSAVLGLTCGKGAASGERCACAAGEAAGILVAMGGCT